MVFDEEVYSRLTGFVIVLVVLVGLGEMFWWYFVVVMVVAFVVVAGKSGVSNSSCGFASIRYVSYGVVVVSDICGGVFDGYIICSNSSSLKLSSSLQQSKN